MVIETLGKIMSEYWKDVKKLSEFRLDTINEADLRHVLTRITLLNTKARRPSTYIVTAFPTAAKEKFDSQGLVVNTWPEVVLGIIGETPADDQHGSEKWWAIYPTLKTGKGWRKKHVHIYVGRDRAARRLLEWWATENENRILNGGK
jgi:hypothetical protein